MDAKGAQNSEEKGRLRSSEEKMNAALPQAEESTLNILLFLIISLSVYGLLGHIIHESVYCLFS